MILTWPRSTRTRFWQRPTWRAVSQPRVKATCRRMAVNPGLWLAEERTTCFEGRVKSLRVRNACSDALPPQRYQSLDGGGRQSVKSETIEDGFSGVFGGWE